MAAPDDELVTRFSRGRLVLGCALLILGVGLWVWLTADQSHRTPDRAEMEELVGETLGAPSYTSSSHWEQFTQRIRLWPDTFTMTAKNAAVYVAYEGDAWTYPFTASESYRPPPARGFECTEFDGSLWCDAESSGEWRYRIDVDRATSRGTLTVVLAPDP